MDQYLLSHTQLTPYGIERLQKGDQNITFEILFAENKTTDDSPYKKYLTVITDGDSRHLAVIGNNAAEVFYDAGEPPNCICTSKEVKILKQGDESRNLFIIVEMEIKKRIQVQPKEVFDENKLIQKRETFLLNPREARQEVPRRSPEKENFTIDQLKSGCSSFVLQGEVWKKSALKEFDGKFGQSVRFSVTLEDKNKEKIEMTFFGEMASKNFHVFQKGKRFQIENGEVKKTPSEYQGRVGNLQITANKKTTVQEIPSSNKQQTLNVFQKPSQEPSQEPRGRGLEFHAHHVSPSKAAKKEENDDPLRRNDEISTIAEVSKEFKKGSLPPQMKVQAAILSIRNAFYPGCNASENCSRKAKEISPYEWECEHCGKTFSDPRYRHLLFMKLQDRTGILEVKSFDACGETIIGMSANEFAKQSNREKVIQNRLDRKAIFSLKQNKTDLEISNVEAPNS